MNFVEPIRDPETVKKIGEYLKEKDSKLYIMYAIGIYCGLRITDILKLKVKDIKGKQNINIKEQKTGNVKTYPVKAALANEITKYCTDNSLGSSDYLIHRRGTPEKHISRRYAYKVINEAGLHFNLNNLGTHSMRKTFGYHFYKQTNNIVLLMKIFNHNDQNKTLRYIGVEQDTVNEAMRNFDY